MKDKIKIKVFEYLTKITIKIILYKGKYQGTVPCRSVTDVRICCTRGSTNMLVARGM